MFKKILVPIDGSDHSEHVLDYAVDLAKKYSAEIKILIVIEPVVLPGLGFSDESAIITQTQFECQINLQKMYNKTLEDVFNKVSKQNPDLKIEKQYQNGKPADQIIQVAEEEKFDLIVMGSRGRGKIKGLLLGSVSDRVADHAKCPVLIVK